MSTPYISVGRPTAKEVRRVVIHYHSLLFCKKPNRRVGDKSGKKEDHSVLFCKEPNRKGVYKSV